MTDAEMKARLADVANGLGVTLPEYPPAGSITPLGSYIWNLSLLIEALAKRLPSK
jgi:hypothetical protein